MATIVSYRDVLLERQRKAETKNSEKTNPQTWEAQNWQRFLLRNRKALENKSALDWIQNPLGIAGGTVNNALQYVTSGEILQGTKAEGLSLSSGSLSYTKFWRYWLLIKPKGVMEKTTWSPRPSLAGFLFPLLDHKVYLEDTKNAHTTQTASIAETTGPDYPKVLMRRLGRESVYTPVKEETEDPAEVNKAKAMQTVKAKLKALETTQGQLKRNEIIIINYNASPYQAIVLQNRPNEITFEPKSTWASVKSMGRNNPFMMYTGGEDTIRLDISWYANDPNHRDEVLLKCKLLERWTKSDGYVACPPLLQIEWGNSGMFEGQYFILESATYKLTHFQDYVKDKAGNTIDLKLYPNCATQTLVFKKVTATNSTSDEIVSLDKLKGINGIKVESSS